MDCLNSLGRLVLPFALIACGSTPEQGPESVGAAGSGGVTNTGGAGAGGSARAGTGGSGGSPVAPDPCPECAWACGDDGGCDSAQAVSNGRYGSCALHESGRVSCWGTTSVGETAQPIPTYLDINDVLVLAPGAGPERGCAVLNDGHLVCWNDMILGDMKYGDVVDVSADKIFGVGMCVVHASGSVTCKEPVEGITDAVMVAQGSGHSCAVLGSGEVACWGDNHAGQLGVTGVDERERAELVPGVTDAIAIAAGHSHTCVARRDADVMCWGANWYGQLGDGSTTGRFEAKAAPGTSGATHVSAQEFSTCATTDAGLKCWGQNSWGQLGGTDVTDHWSAVVADALPKTMRSSALAESHGCGVTEAGGVLCWGDNWFGQIGGDENYLTVDLPDLGAVELAVSMVHACVVTEEDAVKCWGDNEYGQLSGQGSASIIPRVVDGMSGARHVAVGYQHSCAVRDGHPLSCWGRKDMGQLGNGEGESLPRGDNWGMYSSTPLDSLLESDSIQKIDGGSMQTCAVGADSTATCWGNLGTGRNERWDEVGTPVAVANLTDVRAIEAGAGHTCAIVGPDREVYCWGENDHFQTGSDSPHRLQTPERVEGLSNVQSLSAGSGSSCAVLEDETIECWGANDVWQLGYDGALIEGKTSVPVPVVDVVDVVAVSSATSHSCAVLTSGRVQCWGQPWRGKKASMNKTASATMVMDLDDAVDIAVGSSFSCALRKNGAVRCWGSPANGQLGGIFAPVAVRRPR